MKITDYIVIVAGTSDGLSNRVSEMLDDNEGWQPFGSPFVIPEDKDSDGEVIFAEVCQAMVKYEQ